MPGRIQSLLLQDYQGQARWNGIFATMEGAGPLNFTCCNEPMACFRPGARGNDLLDFAAKDLEYFRQLHG